MSYSVNETLIADEMKY